MVIGERFVWVHIPKTAGDSTRKMFDLVKGSYLFGDHSTVEIKHRTFTQTMAAGDLQSHNIAAKDRILNLRRLPCWVLSHCQHKLRINRIRFSRQDLITGRLRIEHASEEGTSADQVLKRFAGGETIAHWLRTEFLAEDFIEVLGKYVEISEAQRKMIRATRENVNPTYNRDIRLWYTRKQMTYVYESNPSWTMLEKQIYGNTLLDEL